MSEIELVFSLPEGDYDVFELMLAVYKAGFKDAIVGSGTPGLIGVVLNYIEADILDTIRTILKHLPAGTTLREMRSGTETADVNVRLRDALESIWQVCVDTSATNDNAVRGWIEVETRHALNGG